MPFLEPPSSITELRDFFDGPPQSSGFSPQSQSFLDLNNAEFLDAVSRGDLGLVESKLSDENNPVNIDAINSDGLTALQIAVDNKDSQITKTLLDHGADIKVALLQSVFDDDLECVKRLLETKREDMCESGDNYITPTTLAAQLGHHEIVHFLIQEGYLIEEPHDYDCSCLECDAKSDILRSQIAINRFRGLSSPVYMCLLYLADKTDRKDPLTLAFDYNEALTKRASNEAAMRKEYLELSERCKRFAADLYNGCRSMKEIAALLDIDEEDFSLCEDKTETRANIVKRLRTAIKSDHKEFIAHPYNQLLLNIVVYSGIPKWYRRSKYMNIPTFILYTLFFPLLALLYLAVPKHSVSRAMKTPFLKFNSHFSQFIVFLIMIAASALRDNHEPTVIEYIIFLTVVGMIAQETREMLSHRPRISYFFKWWNIITTAMLTLFTLAALSWFLGFAITGSWSVVNFSFRNFAEANDGYQLLLLGSSFYSLAIVVSVFHLIDLCQVNSVLGPLQLSLYRMLRDVLKFLLLFFAIYLAFVLGLRNLYSYYKSVQMEIYRRGNSSNPNRAETNHPFSSLSRASRNMFWALFDKIELKEFNTRDEKFMITQGTGKILFAFYSICAVMVALNMLIAMMTHSYENISQDDDIQWKFSRTKLWLEFVEKGSVLPSPYNLLGIPRQVYSILKRKFRGSRRRNLTTDYQKKKEERTEIIKGLIQRYFLTQELRRKKELSTLKDVEESKLEIIKLLKEGH